MSEGGREGGRETHQLRNFQLYQYENKLIFFRFVNHCLSFFILFVLFCLPFFFFFFCFFFLLFPIVLSALRFMAFSNLIFTYFHVLSLRYLYSLLLYTNVFNCLTFDLQLLVILLVSSNLSFTLFEIFIFYF